MTTTTSDIFYLLRHLVHRSRIIKEKNLVGPSIKSKCGPDIFIILDYIQNSFGNKKKKTALILACRFFIAITKIALL